MKSRNVKVAHAVARKRQRMLYLCVDAFLPESLLRPMREIGLIVHLVVAMLDAMFVRRDIGIGIDDGEDARQPLHPEFSVHHRTEALAGRGSLFERRDK